jgi:glycosidase
VVGSTETALDGSGSSMAHMIGNHDTTRFASVVAGDAQADGWGPTPPVQPEDPEVYARQALALGLVLTLPGIPVLYYGDAIALAGGRDPDNRRVMPADDVLRQVQHELAQRVRRLGTLRRCHPALRQGTRIPFAVGPDRYGFARVHPEGRPALVLLSRRTAASEIAVPAAVLDAGVGDGWYKDALTAERFAVQADVSIPMAPLSLRVLLPEDDPCL